MTEVAGVDELGLIGRGEDAEITTYLEKGILTEMSANAVDLCPVGALTHRPWAHNARPWELKKTESIDVMDAVGSAIRIDTRGREVMRILPRNNDAVNEEWISDKTRHVVDGLKTQRLDRPYIRRDGRLQPATWPEVLDLVAQKLKSGNPARMGAIVGDLAGAEEMFALKELLFRLGVRNIDCRQDGSKLDPKHGRSSYLFNSTIAGIERSDAILLIGTNPRIEAPVLNARIRRVWRQGTARIAYVGERCDPGYPAEQLGTGAAALAELADGKGAFAETLLSAQRPLVIVGSGAAARPDGAGILALAARIALRSTAGKTADWNAFNVLHSAASRVAGLELGFVAGEGRLDVAGMIEAAGKDRLELLYVLGADEIDYAALGRTFIIYQGTHGDAGAHRADIILPGAAYTEKSATFVNTEGRAQITQRAAPPPGEAKEDWASIRALSQEVGHTLPFDTLTALRAAMYRVAPQLARVDSVEPAGWTGVEALTRVPGQTGTGALGSCIKDFYLTNAIARASAVMAEMSALKAASQPSRRAVAE
jgi:NADH-quinone oxidoreductase subunit G